MAATVVIDTVQDLGAEEVFDSVVRLRRRAIVHGVTTGGIGAINEVLTALDTATYSTYSRITGGAYNNLMLVSRTPTVRPGDPTVWDVELVYEPLDSEGQSFHTTNPIQKIILESQTTLKQITTNKYPSNVTDSRIDSDLAGTQIMLYHTYPDGTDTYTYTDKNGNTQNYMKHPRFPGIPAPQSGEISVTDTQELLTCSGIIATDSPWLKTAGMANHVNAVYWMGYSARKWHCTAANYKLHDYSTSPKTFMFHFEFILNKDTWDETAVFIDESTGQPPPNMVENEGYKTIKWLPERDFNSFLGVTFWG